MQKYSRILINPNFLCRSLTGIERFALETCSRLDKLLDGSIEFLIPLPANAKTKPEFKNIKIIPLSNEIKSFPKWDIIEFPRLLKKYKAQALSFSNTAPLGKKTGLSFIHDIYPKDCPEDFSNFKGKLISLYSCFHYKNICKNARMIFTVSEFSKQRISQVYKCPLEKIVVIPNGWEHIKSINEEVFSENSDFLKKGTFYFTLGSLQKRKNLRWIARYAKEHPEEKFAISGKIVSGFESEDIENLKNLPNVLLLGYVSDQQVKYLMKNCRAFIFPSYYEGFGIPPLEALASGTKIVVGNAASLPEIYGKTAIYIDPDNTNCNLSKMTDSFNPCQEDIENVLNEYSYDKAAKKLYTSILKINSGAE